jgi:hypothetical protein
VVGSDYRMNARPVGRAVSMEPGMKYILMMNVPCGGAYEISTWSEKDVAAHLAFMKGFAEKLTTSGELAGAEGLAAPEQAKLVRAGADGRPVTDGVFPESKEFLAGYWMVGSPERAYAIAAEASAAPGMGGAPLNMPIEVRQVMSMSQDCAAGS